MYNQNSTKANNQFSKAHFRWDAANPCISGRDERYAGREKRPAL